jgi:GTP-binding protein
MQAPKYAQPGQPSRSIDLILELKVIADVGLVGFPSVGKSTLLSRISNAKPEVAAYHFTTLIPVLGVVDLDDARGFVMADMPGLVEGAAEGVGLGDEFLAHIERCRILVHMVDAAGSEGRDPLDDIEKINRELEKYDADLTKKTQIIACNKVDLIPEDLRDTELDPVRQIREKYEPLGVKVFAISAATGKGIRELLYYISDQLQKLPQGTLTYAQEFNPETELTPEEVKSYTVTYNQKDQAYDVEGPAIEKMLGYTNLDTEKGLAFLQRFIEDNGITDKLRELGCKEGDIVRLYGHTFEFME